ncbi:hypothetical protein GGX14DRAFT_396806 [Mycena pura]|uniref:Uncharacterized protein n=1 Tax=Mycena pura TaxID=153505 RepID=A0AAD6VAA5_9AGAR|nr:hypothetical protein GGX14DRAFT_396806 [Mycena pura]
MWKIRRRLMRSSEAFSHAKQPGDAAEEARIPELVAQWKEKHRESKAKRKGNKATDADDEVEDTADSARSSDRASLLRGYTLTAWRIQQAQRRKNATWSQQKAESDLHHTDVRRPGFPCKVLRSKALGFRGSSAAKAARSQ